MAERDSRAIASSFPRDHASHPDYKIEWWYYTGNLQTAAGRRFGYQVTFFRVGVDPSPVNPSRWAVRDLYMTHLAVSDPSGNRYRFQERLNRGGPGLAGAETDRYRVWNDDWTASLDASGRHVHSRGRHSRRRRSGARRRQAAGDQRRRRHQPEGRADRQRVALLLAHAHADARRRSSIDGERFEVTGESWMDHEFGTSFLEPEQQGWDWLSIQLEDGRELMLYQLRRGDGSRDPRSSGTLVDSSGRTRHSVVRRFHDDDAGRTFRAPSGATLSRFAGPCRFQASR